MPATATATTTVPKQQADSSSDEESESDATSEVKVNKKERNQLLQDKKIQAVAKVLNQVMIVNLKKKALHHLPAINFTLCNI